MDEQAVDEVRLEARGAVFWITIDRQARRNALNEQVVARIAHGLSADGIAAELDVAPSTVVTLRKRAYAKLAEAGLPADRLRLARWLG